MKKLLAFLWMIITGNWRMFRDVVFPIVDIVNHLKNLKGDKRNGKYFVILLTDILKLLPAVYEKYTGALRVSILELYPELEKTGTDIEPLIDGFYKKTNPLNARIKNAVYMKLASVILRELSEHDLEENESDAVVQIAYTYKKNKPVKNEITG